MRFKLAVTRDKEGYLCLDFGRYNLSVRSGTRGSVVLNCWAQQEPDGKWRGYYSLVPLQGIWKQPRLFWKVLFIPGNHVGLQVLP